MRPLPVLLAAVLGLATGPLVTSTAQATVDRVPPLVFASDRDGDPDIYLRKAGGKVVKLTANRVADLDAVWSPDGRKLAFVRAVGNGTALFVMDADGTDVRRLTKPVRTPEGLISRDSSPAWSPDGKRLAFASDRAGGETEIYRIDADGTHLKRLTRTAAHVSDHNPTWSPNGRWVAFDSDRTSFFNREVYRMRPDGTGVQRLTRTADGIDDGAPDYSPDGRQIVFSSMRGNGDQDLYTMRADGKHQRRLGPGEDVLDEVFPQWSADGLQVVFWTFGGPEAGRDKVWAIDADGTGRRQVTTGKANDWSPDPHPRRMQ